GKSCILLRNGAFRNPTGCGPKPVRFFSDSPSLRMALNESSDLFPNVRNPNSTRIINERCRIRTQDGHCVVDVSGIVLAQYSSTDHMAEAYAMVSLVEQGWAYQSEVARAFGYSARTVRRHQRRFENGGLAALDHGSG